MFVAPSVTHSVKNSTFSVYERPLPSHPEEQSLQLNGYSAQYFPVRPLIRIGESDGAWLVAHKAEERKKFNELLRRRHAANRPTESSGHGGGTSGPPASHQEDEPTCLDGFYLLRVVRVEDPSFVCHVDLSGRNLTEVKEEDLQLFDSVTSLKVGENLLKIEPLNGFPNLRELEIPFNGLRNLKLTADSFPNLEFLDVSYNELSKEDLFNIGLLKRLRRLHAGGNGLSELPEDLSLPEIALDGEANQRFQSLECLMLDDNRLSDPKAFASLASLRKLKVLNLEKNEFAGIPYLKVSEETDGVSVTLSSSSAAGTSRGRTRSARDAASSGRRSTARSSRRRRTVDSAAAAAATGGDDADLVVVASQKAVQRPEEREPRERSSEGSAKPAGTPAPPASPKAAAAAAAAAVVVPSGGAVDSQRGETRPEEEAHQDLKTPTAEKAQDEVGSKPTEESVLQPSFDDSKPGDPQSQEAAATEPANIEDHEEPGSKSEDTHEQVSKPNDEEIKKHEDPKPRPENTHEQEGTNPKLDETNEQEASKSKPDETNEQEALESKPDETNEQEASKSKPDETNEQEISKSNTDEQDDSKSKPDETDEQADSKSKANDTHDQVDSNQKSDSTHTHEDSESQPKSTQEHEDPRSKPEDTHTQEASSRTENAKDDTVKSGGTHQEENVGPKLEVSSVAHEDSKPKTNDPSSDAADAPADTREHVQRKSEGAKSPKAAVVNQDEGPRKPSISTGEINRNIEQLNLQMMRLNRPASAPLVELAPFDMREIERAIGRRFVDRRRAPGPAPFPALKSLNLGGNRVAREEALVACGIWPALAELLIHDNPLSRSRSGELPLLHRLLTLRLGVRVAKQKPQQRPKPRIEVEPKPSRRVVTRVPPVPKMDVDRLLLSIRAPSPPPQAHEEQATAKGPAGDASAEEETATDAASDWGDGGDNADGAGVFLTSVADQSAEAAAAGAAATDATKTTGRRRDTDSDNDEEDLDDVDLLLSNAFGDNDEDDSADLPQDVQGSVKALQYLLDHPITLDHSRPPLVEAGAAYREHRVTRAAPAPAPRPTRAELVSDAIETSRRANPRVELPLAGLLKGGRPAQRRQPQQQQQPPLPPLRVNASQRRRLEQPKAAGGGSGAVSSTEARRLLGGVQRRYQTVRDRSLQQAKAQAKEKIANMVDDIRTSVHQSLKARQSAEEEKQTA